MRTPRRTTIGLLTATLAFAAMPLAVAQIPFPQLRSVFPPGGKAGDTVEVTIGGSDLEETTELVFSHPGIRCERIAIPATEFSPERHEPLRYRISIAPEVPVGSHEVTARTRLGFTAPRAFAVGSLPEINHTQNNSIETAEDLPLGTVVNGHADTEAIDYYRLELKEGQRVLIQCRAEPIDSRMDATLAILDGKGRELMRDRDTLGRDALLDFNAPGEGSYTLQVFDFTYRGGTEYPYRLTASSAPHIDFIYPPAGQAGTTGKFKIFGRNLPGGSKGEGVRLGRHELESVEVDIALPRETTSEFVVRSLHTSLLPGMDYRLEGNGQMSNPIRIGFAAAPIIQAQESPDDQAVTVPCEVHGRFDSRNDLDRYRFEARKGAPLWIECFAERLGNGSDPLLFIECITTDDKGNEQFKELASNDDAGSRLGGRHFTIHSRDSALHFTPPEDGRYRATVLTQAGEAGPAAIYRLVLREAQPDFDLIAVPWHATDGDKHVNRTPAILRQGGTALVRVFALRRHGFREAIDLTVEGLPQGVTCPALTIKKGKDLATFIFVSADDAPSWQGFITIVGKAGDTVRKARAGAISWSIGSYDTEWTKPRLSTRLPLSVYAGEKAPIVIQPPEPHRWEVDMNGTLELPIKLVKQFPMKGDFIIQPVGLPYTKDAPTLKLKEKDSEGKLTITFKKTKEFPIAPGEWHFALRGQGTVKYRNNVAGIEPAEQERKRIEELEKKVQEEAKQAKAAVEPARKAFQAVENALKAASPEAKAELEGRLKETQTSLQDAEKKSKYAEDKAKRAAAELKTASERAKRAGERAKAKDVKHATYSVPLTVVVKPPLPKEKGK